MCVYAYNTLKHELSKYSPVDLNVAKCCNEPLQMESVDDELLESEIVSYYQHCFRYVNER